MATEAQIEANRVNAQKSTGPRTPEGKEKASQNALKHGLLTRQMVVPGEDPEEFELHRQELLAEMAPAGPMESLLAERIVRLSWRLLRAERLQTAAVGTLAEEKKKWVWSKEDNQYVVLQGTKPGPVAAGSEEEALAADRKVVKDFAEGRILDRLLVYEGRIEHHLYRTMAQLEKRQRLGRERAAASSPCDGSDESGTSESVESEYPDGISGLAAPTAVGPAAGVCTNVPEAETCKTNPISPGDGWDEAAGAGDVGQSCKTNPICGSPSGTGIPSAPLSGQALPVKEDHRQACPEPCERDADATIPPDGGTTNLAQTRGQLCKTNPISGGAGRDEATGARDTGQLCKTDPIGGGGSSPRGGYTPVFRRRI